MGGEETAKPRANYRDPLIRGFAGFAALVTAWLIWGGGSTPARAEICWLTQGILDSSTALLAVRLALRPTLPTPVRRFYRGMTFAGCCFSFGDASQAVLVVAHPGPGSTQGGPIQLGTFALGAATVVVILVLYPTAVNTGRERLRFWLDAVTVLVGGAALAWALAADPGVNRANALLSAGLVLTIAFAATKLLYSGAAPMGRKAVLGCIAAAGAQCLGIFVASATNTGTLLGTVLATQVISSVLLTSALRIQELETPVDAAWPTRTVRRSHNKLPYLATLAATGTLAAVLPRTAGPKAWGVLVAVVVISVLVSIRQIDAFVDNATLIGRLDNSLAALGEKERWYRSLLQHSTDITMVMDADGTVTFASPAVARVLGIQPQEVIGQRFDTLVHPEDLDLTHEAFRRMLAEPGQTTTIAARCRHTGGGWRWLDGACTNLLQVVGVEGIICNARDVTEARRFQDRLRHEATHDPLTGLPNRALFTERLAAAATGQCALLLLDLDDFKLINDVHGHPAGDRVLVGVAGRLRECAGPDDTPARLGGDEFAMVLPGADEADAAEVVRRIQNRLLTPVATDAQQLIIRASIGFGVGAAIDAEVLLGAADQAMYVVKRALAR